MSWLSSFVKHNRGFIGNAIKNISPALAFTPLGPLGAGLAGAFGRAIQPGANLGSIVKSGVSNAAIGGGAKAGLGALQNAFAPSSSASINALPGAGGGSSAGVASGGGMSADPMDEIIKRGIPGVQVTPSAAPDAGGFMSGLGKAASGVAHFAKDNPTAVGAGLQGLGHIATAGADNAYRRAQTNSLNIQNEMSEEEMARRKRLAEAFGPLQQALMAQMSGMSKGYNIAPNPYGGGQ